ncbi:alpha-1,2-fucosyltransferase [Nodularia spumigena]|uniref:alpha-1,2-fucosyltransferase n=1 Tax=Nodularia spumigena TaxID=70799 RepID=UPI002FEE2162
MSKCKHNVIANSTYSYWAAYINDNVNKICIYPKQWYKQRNLNAKKDIFIPKNWIGV